MGQFSVSRNSLSTKAFDKACRAAGIENFRFHDLRHTWASWLIQSGVGLAELQELGGWESVEMVRRYAHLAPDHLHKHSQQIDILMADFRHTAKDDKEKWVSAVTLTH
ncbi:tyrosine-type recombinase/integrase [Chitinimonas sp. PSY-7]|uniref:tyrosine-type recombinase/integrase n=1 Tax=Chitinimonas sp. PSY-7 TaxID=3459088 RepID=UPI00403FCD8C